MKNFITILTKRLQNDNLSGTLQTNQEEKVKFNLHYCYNFVTPLLVYVWFFAHMCKKNKFIQLHLKNSKHFYSFQYLFNKKVMIKASTISMFFAFTLVWRGYEDCREIKIGNYFWKENLEMCWLDMSSRLNLIPRGLYIRRKLLKKRIRIPSSYPGPPWRPPPGGRPPLITSWHPLQTIRFS